MPTFIGRILDLRILFRARAKERRGDFEGALSILDTHIPKGRYPRAFANVYRAKLLVAGRSPRARVETEKVTTSIDNIIQVKNGIYLSTYAEYLAAILDNDAHNVARLSDKLDRIPTIDFIRGCLPAFDLQCPEGNYGGSSLTN